MRNNEGSDLRHKMGDKQGSELSRYEQTKNKHAKNSSSSSYIIHKDKFREVQNESDDEEEDSVQLHHQVNGDSIDRDIIDIDTDNDDLDFGEEKSKHPIASKKKSLPPQPNKSNVSSTPQDKSNSSVYPSLLQGKSNLNAYINSDKKQKPQSQNANAQGAQTIQEKPQQAFQISNLKAGKFFKTRKSTHSRSRAGERETLYEESMKLKMQNNMLKEENLRLKTQVQITEKEIEKRDELVENVVISLNKNLKCSECSLKDPASPVKHKKLMAILKSSLTNNLKKQVKDLRQEVETLKKDKMDKKVTKMNELQAELDAMTEECSRLRIILEENFKGMQLKSKDADMEALRNEIMHKDQIIEQMQSDNTEIAQA